METVKAVLEYLKKKDLILSTAESCTAGKIIHLLGKIPGSGEVLDVGYVVYSQNAKKNILAVRQATIDTYTLTSEEVVCEMVEGALKNSAANVVVATTGVAGSKPMDGIAPGTICFGWGFQQKGCFLIYSDTKHFKGTRNQIITRAAEYALLKLPFFHKEYVKHSQKGSH